MVLNLFIILFKKIGNSENSKLKSKFFGLASRF